MLVILGGPSHPVEVLSDVSKCTKAVMSLMEKHALGKLPSSLSYNAAVSAEFVSQQYIRVKFL